MADEKKSDEKTFWLDDKKNVDKIWYGLIIFCALTVISDAFYHKHTVHPAEDFVWGMYGWYGLLGSIFLVLSAKILRKFVMRDEDYYKEADDD